LLWTPWPEKPLSFQETAINLHFMLFHFQQIRETKICTLLLQMKAYHTVNAMQNDIETESQTA